MSINILRHAMEMLKRDPRYAFTQDQMLALKPFWDSLSAADKGFMRRMVEEGRFETTTGMYVQPDIAESDFESLTREFLPAKNWMEQTFGRKVVTAWNIDTYGHTIQMPQLFHKAGLKYFVFERGVPPSMMNSVRSPFYWRSPDGSQVLCTWLSGGYGLQWRDINGHLASFIRSNVEGNDKVFVLWGEDLYIPNETTKEMEAKLRAAAVADHIPIKKVVFCTPRQYFHDVETSGKNLPTYTYDFNPPQNILDLRGLYGERPANKLANRRAEETLESAEKFSSIASAYGSVYPQEKLRTAWEAVLLNQDHDAIPGSHSDPVDDAIMSRYAGAIEAGRDATAKSLYAISRQVNTSDGGTYPFLVFNPLSFRRTEVVRYDPLFRMQLSNFQILDSEGRPVPFSPIYVSRVGKDGPLKMAEVEFVAKDVPGMGYRLYKIVPVDGSIKVPAWGSLQSVISNEFYALKIDTSTGSISSLIDRRTGEELLDTRRYGANELVLQEEKDPNVEGILNFTGQEIRGSQFPVRSIQETENDLLTTVRIEGGFLDGKTVREITLYKSIPRIDFRTELLSFPGHDGVLAAVFPLMMKGRVQLQYETHNAVTERPDGIFESQTWMNAQMSNFGLGFINRGMAGFQTDNGLIRMILLRSATNYRGYYAPRASEAGSHSFEYSLLPHQGTWNDAGLIREAHSFNSPLRVLATDAHSGSLPTEHSFVAVESGNFEITAIKRAENGSAFILRGHEMKGHEGTVRLKFAMPVTQVQVANLVEEPSARSEIPVRDNASEFHCLPFGFVTLKVTISPALNNHHIDDHK